MVRPPEIQGITALDRHPGKLDDCVCRVLLSSARESNRLVSILSSAAENDSGSDHVSRVFGFFRHVSARAVSMELRRCLCVHRRGGILYVL